MACPLVSVRLLESNTSANLIVHGQGVFLFATTQECSFTVSNKDNTAGLEVHLLRDSVEVSYRNTSLKLLDPTNSSGLTTINGAYYWFSLDSHNQRLYVGVGEPRLETVIYRYSFPTNNAKSFIESLTTISIPNTITPMKLLRDPVTVKTPLIVKDMNDLTMDDIANNLYLAKSYLSDNAQKLYHCISGKNFLLNDVNFPDFSNAIEYSIATPGLWCNTKLKEKSTEFNKDKPNPTETYLRITLGQNNGESPGISYVMEIWPVGHYSPIHSHSQANAVIRVLHGKIHVSLYPFLCAEKDGVDPFANHEFVKDTITWISPTLNQTHQLKNLSSSTETCITIQCYMYDDDDVAHYDYFDYIDDNGKKEQYEPDSDMDFVVFKELMKQEWNTR